MTTNLARLVALVADDLHRKGYAAAPVVHRAAQVLAAVPVVDDAACPTCGGEVVQPARGRRRVHCSTTCRNRAAKRKRNANLNA